MAKHEVRTIEVTLMAQILKADPDFYAKRRDQKLYEFSNGREFRGDPEKVSTAYPTE